MGPELDLLEWDDHRYDVRTLAAPMEFVHLRTTLERLKGSRDLSILVCLLMDWEHVLDDRVRDVHDFAREHPAGTVCTCGLTVPKDVPLPDATGHLDLRTWMPADTFVAVLDELRGSGAEPSSAKGVCQRCGWSSRPATVPEARRSARRHRCRTTRRDASAAST